MMLLQPGVGATPGDLYLSADPDEIAWGLLPNATSRPVRTVDPGTVVCLDTISHEGILEDQGRDPAAFFAAVGITGILSDTAAVAASGTHDPARQGPHVITGPIAVRGARPGDVLEVEVLALARRTDYGVISNRHGKGALPGEYPLPPVGHDPADPVPPVCTVATVDTAERGVIALGDGRALRFPLNPFLGIMGVAVATDRPVHSVPPGPHGGNLDIRMLGVGAKLFLPVQVPGALFYTGDPHFAMGDGEVALTAFEAPLRATLRLRLHNDPAMRKLAATLATPFAETRDDHLVIGLDTDLDAAVARATRNAIAFLGERHGVPAPLALAYLSATADFRISQVVDIVKGVHCCLRKSDLEGL
ncbi:acetamidase/formamidase family protein [Nocardia sp. alder85J]|uniref:acetamidase/formamidase family protein n=1 Tax=Nocardia sp. alder85J TaxID=2862949 RepID=UPI001CD541AD|nr:acetamidase/formamidase family protein [Nocardia sp. alder85J]MCX4093259.1 acetamidase/formamidase family protein [Nocardia sp. alder85J]